MAKKTKRKSSGKPSTAGLSKAAKKAKAVLDREMKALQKKKDRASGDLAAINRQLAALRHR